MKTEVMEQETRVQLFHKEEFGTIRTVIIDGEPWFSGKDVAVSNLLPKIKEYSPDSFIKVIPRLGISKVANCDL